VKNQSLAPFFYATKQELFRCGSSAIADERRGYLQKFRTRVFIGPPVYKKLRKSGTGGPETSLFQPVKFGPTWPDVRPRCRSPPPPFRFALNPIETEERQMEVAIKINGQALSVEVSVDVYEYLDRADHKEENLAHEKRRHWDIREFDEYIIAAEGRTYQETPEQYVCRMETQDELMTALSLCTEAQRRRFLLYALDGLSYEQIARLDGCSKVSVYESIAAVRKKLKEFFKYHPNETRFSG